MKNSFRLTHPVKFFVNILSHFTASFLLIIVVRMYKNSALAHNKTFWFEPAHTQRLQIIFHQKCPEFYSNFSCLLQPRMIDKKKKPTLNYAEMICGCRHLFNKLIWASSWLKIASLYRWISFKLESFFCVFWLNTVRVEIILNDEIAVAVSPLTKKTQTVYKKKNTKILISYATILGADGGHSL